MRQFAKVVALKLLRAYKWGISPMFPPACRFVPTCSEYAMEAVERNGALHGGWMALWRLLRCHPLAHGGYDPVVKAGASDEGATNFAQGPEPSRISDDSSRRLTRCATATPNSSNLNGATLSRGTI